MPLGHSWGLRATVPKLGGTVSRHLIQQQTTTNVVYPLMNHPQKRFTTCNYWRYPPIWDHVKWRSDILRISFPFISLPVTGVRGEQLSWRGMNKIHKSSPYLFGGSEHFLFFHHMWDVILPIDFHIFQRGRSTTNQICLQFSTIPKWINGRFLAATPTESTWPRTRTALVSSTRRNLCRCWRGCWRDQAIPWTRSLGCWFHQAAWGCCWGD